MAVGWLPASQGCRCCPSLLCHGRHQARHDDKRLLLPRRAWQLTTVSRPDWELRCTSVQPVQRAWVGLGGLAGAFGQRGHRSHHSYHVASTQEVACSCVCVASTRRVPRLPEGRDHPPLRRQWRRERQTTVHRRTTLRQGVWGARLVKVSTRQSMDSRNHAYLAQDRGCRRTPDDKSFHRSGKDSWHISANS